MLKRLLTKKITTVSKAAIIVSVFSLLSRFLGLLRDRIFASQFGAGVELDIYYAAFRIPDLVYNLIVLGALSAGFIPLLARYVRAEDDQLENEDARLFVSTVFNVLFIALTFLSAVLFVFAPQVMYLLTPGFDIETRSVVISMTRIILLSPIFLGLSGVLSGLLQTFRHFITYSLAPVFYNVGIIIGAIFFSRWWGIYGLAYGVVLGALLHFLVQLPSALHLGFRPRAVISFDKNVRQIIRLMGPRVLTLVLTQANLLIITSAATLISAGSVAVFNLANNLQYFPVGMFGISFAVAAFPSLAIAYGNKDEKKFITQLRAVTRKIIFFIMPMTIIFVLLSAQIVRVVLGSGSFDWHDTILTAQSLRFFSISLFAQALIPLFARVFFVRHNTTIPLFAAVAGLITNVLCLWVFVPMMGAVALALSFSLASVVQWAILLIFLQRVFPGWEEPSMWRFFRLVVMATVVMAICLQGTKIAVGEFVDFSTFVGVFVQLGISFCVSILIYFAFLFFLKNEEAHQVLRFVKGNIAPMQRVFHVVTFGRFSFGSQSVTTNLNSAGGDISTVPLEEYTAPDGGTYSDTDNHT